MHERRSDRKPLCARSSMQPAAPARPCHRHRHNRRLTPSGIFATGNIVRNDADIAPQTHLELGLLVP